MRNTAQPLKFKVVPINKHTHIHTYIQTSEQKYTEYITTQSTQHTSIMPYLKSGSNTIYNLLTLVS